MKVVIRLEHDDQGFRAQATQLPGCQSRGNTAREARDRLDEAIRGYIAAVNNFVPEHIEHEVVEM
ncbi:MAG: type II toxin-antitoxin system HicB family antitoxin [Phycisphaerae bacterium]